MFLMAYVTGTLGPQLVVLLWEDMEPLGIRFLIEEVNLLLTWWVGRGDEVYSLAFLCFLVMEM